MKTYYCVTSTIKDDLKYTAAITSIIEAEQRPGNTYTCTTRRDIYNDWFDTIEEAEEFIKEIKES